MRVKSGLCSHSFWDHPNQQFPCFYCTQIYTSSSCVRSLVSSTEDAGKKKKKVFCGWKDLKTPPSTPLSCTLYCKWFFHFTLTALLFWGPKAKLELLFLPAEHNFTLQDTSVSPDTAWLNLLWSCFLWGSWSHAILPDVQFYVTIDHTMFFLRVASSHTVLRNI